MAKYLGRTMQKLVNDNIVRFHLNTRKMLSVFYCNELLLVSQMENILMCLIMNTTSSTTSDCLLYNFIFFHRPPPLSALKSTVKHQALKAPPPPFKYGCPRLQELQVSWLAPSSASSLCPSFNVKKTRGVEAEILTEQLGFEFVTWVLKLHISFL